MNDKTADIQRGGLLRSMGAVSFITLLSRVFGYVRDRMIAYYLGTAFGADAFYAIFRFPNTFRRLVGEGAMSAAFIPVFSDYLENRGEGESRGLANKAFYALALILAVITLMGVVFSSQILSVTGFAEKYAGADVELAVKLNRIIFPYLFFICLSALFMAVLNSFDSFAVPAFTPVLLNLSIITAGALFASKSEHPSVPLAWGIFAGGILQLGFQVPFLVRRGINFRPELSFTDPGIVKMAGLLLPTMLGAGIYQVNILVVTVVATFLEEGSVSSLYYAGRIMEFTLGIYAISVATVILPSMSRQGARGDTEGLKSTLAFGLRLVSFIAVPASTGMILLSGPIVDVLFRGGEYTEKSIAMTSGALVAYSIGLIAVSGISVAVRAFYAVKDTRTPVAVAGVSFAVNLALVFTLMKPMGHVGLALASTFAAFVNAVLLLALFMKKMGTFGGVGLAKSVVRTVFASAVMGAAVYLFADFSGLFETGSYVLRGVLLFAAIALGAAVFGLTAVVLRSEEPAELMGMFRKRS